MSIRVLLCDDEIHILRAAEFKIARAGFDVSLRRRRPGGWEAIQAERPDMLITDYQMPRLDGMQLIQRLRQEPALRDLPIVMLTAKGFESRRKSWRKNGA